jgi:DHA3 family macrolide efflux protein-like MFS transporter
MKESKDYKLLLSQPKFLMLLAADIVNRFGDSLDAVVYSWIMYEITGSEALMAMILGINYIPTVILQPIAGTLIDRHRKKNMMVLADMGRGMVVITTILLYAGGQLNSYMLIILTLCTSTLEAFRVPAAGAFVPVVLEKECYKVGKAAHYSIQRAMELVGYMVVGGLIALIGAVGVLWIDVMTFAISAVILLLIKDGEKIDLSQTVKKNVLQDFKDGLKYVVQDKTLQAVFLIGLMINFCIMPLTVFQTPYVSDYLEAGPEMLSAVKMLMVVGMMAGSAVMPKIKVSSGKLAILAGIIMGVSLLEIAVVPSIARISVRYTVLIMGMFLIGLGGGILNVIVGSSFLTLVPKEMFGRIGGLVNAIMVASMPVSSFFCSLLAVKLSVTQIFIIFGIFTIFVYVLAKAKRFFVKLQ